MATSVTVRNKLCPTREIIGRMLDQGLDKETIRKVCRALEITNFSQTWPIVVQRR